MKLPKLTPGRVLRRDNRFRATVQVGNRQALAHVPNSGRLTELFTPNRPVWLAPATNPERVTAYDLKLVEFASTLVSMDARLPNPLFAEALRAGKLAMFPYPDIKGEVKLGKSRLDFRLSGPKGICWVETKSVTLVEEGVARFPDAPTGRGRRHLLELIEINRSGDQAAVVFVIQRPDAMSFSPHKEADPEFAGTLRQAADSGVQVLAFTCQVTLESIVLNNEIPVIL
jgi:sugar fermentation stimulation protein A